MKFAMKIRESAVSHRWQGNLASGAEGFIVTENRRGWETSPAVWRSLLLRKTHYCIGENGAGSRSLLSCVMGLTEPLGGQTSFSRVSARIR